MPQQKPILRKGIAYWPTWDEARRIRDIVRKRCPEARIVAYEVGFAVQLVRGGRYVESAETPEE